MARNIAADDGEVWRAVMVFRTAAGREVGYKEGAYSTAGPAKARVTYWKNRVNRYDYVDGVWLWMTLQDAWIERGNVLWSRVSEGS